MFKSALSSVASTVVSAAKNTLKDYQSSTSTQSGGVVGNIMQQGIANMAYRSPIMADIAQTVLDSFHVENARKQKINDYVKSSSSDGMRDSVKSSMEPNSSQAKIDKEMISILDRMSKAIDKSGIEEAKKSALFKQYEKYFTEFKKSSPTSTKPSPPTHNNPSEDHSEILGVIANNTHKTVNALENLTNNGIGGSRDHQSSDNSHGTPSFDDPLTGRPSVRDVISQIGGTFLQKVFDDETIEKFVGKTKSFFSKSKEKVSETTIDPVQSDTKESVQATDDQPSASPSQTQSKTAKRAAKVKADIEAVKAELPVLEAPKPPKRPSKRGGNANALATAFSTELPDLDSEIVPDSVQPDTKPVKARKSRIAKVKPSVVAQAEIIQADNEAVKSELPEVLKPIKRPSKRGGSTEGISKAFVDINESLNLSKDGKPVVKRKPRAKKVVSAIADKVSDSKIPDDPKVATKADETLTNILEELKKISKNTGKKEHSGTEKAKIVSPSSTKEKIKEPIKSKVFDGIKSRLPGVANALKQTPGKILQVGKVGLNKAVQYGKSGVQGVARAVPKALKMGATAAKYVPHIAGTAARAVVGGAVSSGVGSLVGSAAGGLLAGGVGSAIGGAIGGTVAGGVLAAGAITAGAAAIAGAGGAAVDWAAGKMGVGGNKIDQKQDDANWERSSTWEKIQSGAGRGIEKAGNMLFLPHLSNEAQSARIGNETKYLNEKYGVAAKAKTSDIEAIQPAKDIKSRTISSLNTEKVKQDTEATKKSQQPVIINAPSSSTPSKSSSPVPQLITGSSVRNADSTYERVQMQDFWPRSI